MKYGNLGRTGLIVSELCHGTLVMGSLQANISDAAGAAAIEAALAAGVNFFDTAQMYGTYGHLRAGLAGVTAVDGKPLVIASKTMAKTAAEAKEAVEDGLRQLGRDHFDVFLLHSVDGVADLVERTPALEYLVAAQAEGLIGHLGLSTHSVGGVLAALDHPELPVLLPILNKAGRGLRHGSMPEMVAATRQAHAAGKGIYAMKALAGGHLGLEFPEALNWVRELGCVDAVAVGMKSVAEVEADVAVFEGREISALETSKLYAEKRVKVIQACTGCGACAQVCPAAALRVKNGKAECDPLLCVMCGYCSQACPNFAIRLV